MTAEITDPIELPHVDAEIKKVAEVRRLLEQASDILRHIEYAEPDNAIQALDEAIKEAADLEANIVGALENFEQGTSK